MSNSGNNMVNIMEMKPEFYSNTSNTTYSRHNGKSQYQDFLLSAHSGN